MQGGERVQTHAYAGGVVRVQRWVCDPPDRPHDRREVAIGWLPDGRWFVDLLGPDRESRAWPTEGQARDVAGRMMADGGLWVEVPASYDARQRPATPGPWVRVAGRWQRPG